MPIMSAGPTTFASPRRRLAVQARLVALLLLLLSMLSIPVGCRQQIDVVELYPFEARVAVRLLEPRKVEAPLQKVPKRVERRARRLGQLLWRAGCRGKDLDYQLELPRPEVVCRLPGASRDAILVTARLDPEPGAPGNADNWTGVAMLPTLYRSLRATSRQHTYIFAGFSRSEHSLRTGAEEYLQRVGAQDLRAVISLVGVGLSTSSAWTAKGDPNLWLDLFSVSKSIGIPVEERNFLHELEDDGQPFRRADIPAILLHSYTRETARIFDDPVGDRDIRQVQLDEYYASYRLIAIYLGYLDQSLNARRSLAQLQ